MNGKYKLKNLACLMSNIFFPGALPKSTGTEDFEFFRIIPCTSILGIFHFSCTGRFWLLTTNSFYWGLFSFSLYRRTLSFHEKSVYWDFSPALEIDFEEKIPCTGISHSTGNFEFFRKISCTGDFSFSMYRKTLNFYDKFPVMVSFYFPCTGRLWVFTINSR